MRKKILFIINSLTGGGAERVMATLLRHSGDWRDRFDVSLALLDDEPAAYQVPGWVTVHQLDCAGSFPASVLRLRALVRQLRPDITLSFLTRANVANSTAMKPTGRPWIISERVNTSAHFAHGLSARFGRALVRRAYPGATRVIAVSQGVADDLAGHYAVPAEHISVIANPVDIDSIAARALEPNPTPVHGPYIAAMGRLVENKNFALLIDAFAASGAEGRLVIAGEGPLRGALEARIAALGLQDRVLLPGFTENPFPLVAGARLFVLPSNAEGFPNGLVEAMATGVAVLSTDCPSGPAEILGNAEHGILVPCNDVEAMAKAIQAYQDDTVRERYAARAAHRARDYAPENATRRYWRVIDDALDEAAISGPTEPSYGKMETLCA